MDKIFTGKIVGRIVEARFAFGGRIDKVFKRTGDKVKSGEILASLDRNQLQIELDRQLAGFEKTRADFEIFNQKHPDPINEEVTKYLKVGEQAQLNSTVKDVELAKLRLDQCDLVSPISGVILDDSGNCPGIYVTPSSFAFKIITLQKLQLILETDQTELSFFRTEKAVKVIIDGIGEFNGQSRLPIPGLVTGKDEPKFEIRIDLPENELFLPGMAAKVSF